MADLQRTTRVNKTAGVAQFRNLEDTRGLVMSVTIVEKRDILPDFEGQMKSNQQRLKATCTEFKRSQPNLISAES